LLDLTTYTPRAMRFSDPEQAYALIHRLGISSFSIIFYDPLSDLYGFAVGDSP
jgi:hypothetical protein